MRSYPAPPGSAAMFTFCAMRSITCRANWPMTACRSCAGLEPTLGPAELDQEERRELAEVRRDIAAWLAKWQTKHRCATGSKRTSRRRSPITGYRYSTAST